MVTARAQLVSGSFLEKLELLSSGKICSWRTRLVFRGKFPVENLSVRKFSAGNFSAGNFPTETFRRKCFHRKFFSAATFPQEKVSGISAYRRKFLRRKFTGIPVSGSSFPGIIISAGKKSGGKLDALLKD